MICIKDIKNAIAKLCLEMLMITNRIEKLAKEENNTEEMNELMLSLFFYTGALSANTHILADDGVKKSVDELVERIFGDDLSRNLKSYGEVWTGANDDGLGELGEVLLGGECRSADNN